MSAGGLIIIDDFTPTTKWPPLYQGRPDTARLHWLEHPHLLAAMVRTQPDASAVLATTAGDGHRLSAMALPTPPAVSRRLPDVVED